MGKKRGFRGFFVTRAAQLRLLEGRSVASRATRLFLWAIWVILERKSVWEPADTFER
jgi:hypothetical protein